MFVSEASAAKLDNINTDSQFIIFYFVKLI